MKSLINTLRYIVRHPLNQGHVAKAIRRFLGWQIGSRLVPGPVVFSWIDGARVVARPGETGITGSIYCGLQEFEEMSYVLHTVGAEDLFVDVGANIGAFTILACAVRGARGYCFEPVPGTFARLQQNLVLNGLAERVRSYNLGVSDVEDELLFTNDPEDTINHVVAADESTSANVERVQVKPLDEVLGAELPSVMKIDVEGFETPVLRGAASTLDKSSLHSSIIELNGSGERYGFDESDVVALLESKGFRGFRYHPFEHRLEALEISHSPGNVIFVRNAELVQENLKRARAFCVNDVEV